jgi:hypothetical protein
MCPGACARRGQRWWVEHLAGTAESLSACRLPATAKKQATGDVVGNVTAIAVRGLPQAELICTLPEWLTDEAAWRQACADEAATYRRILEHSSKISDARERTKAELLGRMAAGHRLVSAFDRHPITLAAIRAQLRDPTTQVLIASGETPQSRKHVEKLFARDSQAHAIALCSDALNEGLNLQGAAALVHLDLPTTLRVAEQRVGRVDRMDSPHDRITVWWPADGKAFATREVEVASTVPVGAMWGAIVSRPSSTHSLLKCSISGICQASSYSGRHWPTGGYGGLIRTR